MLRRYVILVETGTYEGFYVAKERCDTLTVGDKTTQKLIVRLTNFELNKVLPDDVFQLKTLKPSNGDRLIKKETGKQFFISNGGSDLVPANLQDGNPNTGRRVLIYLLSFGFLLGLYVFFKLRSN